MNFGPIVHLRWVARAAYSRHPAARLRRLGRYFTTGPTGEPEHDIADVLLLPLAGLALTLWLLATVPGASDAISMACSAACMP